MSHQGDPTGKADAALSLPTSLRLSLKGIRKTYGHVIALDGIDLDVKAGEILGVAGPNGAGKSTLIRVLAGEDEPDGGEFFLDGRSWAPTSSTNRAAVVHQEPQLWNNLSVGENLYVGRESTRFRYPTLTDADCSILAGLRIDHLASRSAGVCSMAVRQRLEIGRALARNAPLFLFDEPNSALTDKESEHVFDAMRELAAAGRLVVLVSHRLAEIVNLCSRVAVIRDGKVQVELTGSRLSAEAVARELAVDHGRELRIRSRDPAVAPKYAAGIEVTRPALRLSKWSSQSEAFSVGSFEIDNGEVMAVVGVEGSGAREMVSSLAGFHSATGMLTVGEQAQTNPAAYSAFLSGDKKQALFPNLKVYENLIARLGRPHIAGRTGFLRRTFIKRLAKELIARFRIRTSSLEAHLLALSGGNQQKVAIAAALATDPSILVLEEPTRGVDVGSKAEIYDIIRDYVRDGHAAVIYCTEVPEVFELADRFTVIHRGRASSPEVVTAFGSVTDLAAAIAEREYMASENAKTIGTKTDK